MLGWSWIGEENGMAWPELPRPSLGGGSGLWLGVRIRCRRVLGLIAFRQVVILADEVLVFCDESVVANDRLVRFFSDVFVDTDKPVALIQQRLDVAIAGSDGLVIGGEGFFPLGCFRRMLFFF